VHRGRALALTLSPTLTKRGAYHTSPNPKLVVLLGGPASSWELELEDGGRCRRDINRTVVQYR
jgi:hypothetical protein